MSENETESEAKQVMRMACAGKPQTEQEVFAVLAEAERLRCDAHLLTLILAGRLCMYQDDGKMMIKRADATLDDKLDRDALRGDDDDHDEP